MAKKQEIVLSPGRMTFGEFVRFSETAETGSLFEAAQLVIAIVDAWPFDVDLKSEDAVLDLPFPDALAFVKAMRESLSGIFQETGDTDLEVDLRQWKARDFDTFQRSLQEHNFTTALELVSQVVVGWSERPNTDVMELTLDDVTSAFRAINNVVKSSLSEGE
jgi:hypothetical protein